MIKILTRTFLCPCFPSFFLPSEMSGVESAIVCCSIDIVGGYSSSKSICHLLEATHVHYIHYVISSEGYRIYDIFFEAAT